MGLFVILLVFCNFLLCPVIAKNEGSHAGLEWSEEEFTEELLLKPLPDRKVLTHFHFESRAPPSSTNGRHHKLFPKAIAQLVRSSLILKFLAFMEFFVVSNHGNIEFRNRTLVF